MSSGPFVVGRYESSVLGLRMKIRTQPETRNFRPNGVTANTQPPGPVQLRLFANVKMSESGLGVRPRILVVRFISANNLPPGYSLDSRHPLPVLRPALWNSAVPGVSTGLYLNRPVLIVGKLPEIVR